MNVTASDGQHFSDITTVTIRISDRERVSSNSYNSYSNLVMSSGSVSSGDLVKGVSDFKCVDTNVAQHLLDTYRLSGKNNRERDEGVPSRSASRFGTNIHHPVFDGKFPRQLEVDETAPIGTLLMTVRPTFLSSHYTLNPIPSMSQIEKGQECCSSLESLKDKKIEP